MKKQKTFSKEEEQKLLDEYLDYSGDLIGFSQEKNWEDPDVILDLARDNFWSVQKTRWKTIGKKGLPKNPSQEIADIRMALYLKIQDYESQIDATTYSSLLKSYKDFAAMGGRTDIDKEFSDIQDVKLLVARAMKQHKQAAG